MSGEKAPASDIRNNAGRVKIGWISPSFLMEILARLMIPECIGNELIGIPYFVGMPNDAKALSVDCDYQRRCFAVQVESESFDVVVSVDKGIVRRDSPPKFDGFDILREAFGE